MHPVRTAAIVLALLMLGGATVAIASGDHDKGRDGKNGRTASARLVNAAGETVGSVWLHDSRGRDTTVFARVHGLPPGVHGFHIHTTGVCTPPDFTSAGSHLNPAGAMHPNHAGDMSTLLVNADGTGELALETDRFSVRDLRDADGSAVMVHALPDNYANIPTRYSPQPPDATTTGTGDAGGRIACGVVR